VGAALEGFEESGLGAAEERESVHGNEEDKLRVAQLAAEQRLLQLQRAQPLAVVEPRSQCSLHHVHGARV
jgi:hypothetical protein